ncbi:MAG: hypothetical protein HDS11_04290 [Bacteroides sp.]|nr:hypothetical protein [Bacteroides sp.]
MVLVELPKKRKKWFRLSPKLYRALSLEYKLQHYQGKFRGFAYKELHGKFINVPLSEYYHHKAIIGVGRILYFRFKYIGARKVLCTRSQFVDPINLKKHFMRSYKYMRHDYGKYSKLNIFVNLFNWRQSIKY